MHSSLKVSDPMKVQNAARFLWSASSPVAYELIDSHWSNRRLHESQSSFLESNISIWLSVATSASSPVVVSCYYGRAYITTRLSRRLLISHTLIQYSTDLQRYWATAIITKYKAYLYVRDYITITLYKSRVNILHTEFPTIFKHVP